MSSPSTPNMIVDSIIGISNDIPFDCDDMPIAGIERNILLVNWSDLDRAKTKFNELKTRITNVKLKPDARAYMFTGYKRLFNGSTSPAIETANGNKHGISIRIFAMNDNSMDQVNQLIKSHSYIAFVEVNQKGENGINAFEVLGYDCGLMIDDSEGRTYNENDGTYLLNLSTDKDLKEPRIFYKWLERDYAHSKRKFNNYLVDVPYPDDPDYGIFDRTFDKTFE